MNHHRRRRCGPFWDCWHEMGHPNREECQEGEFDNRQAWHRHFTEFLGESPEDHWLFGGRRFQPWTKGEWGPPEKFNPFLADLMSKGGGLLSLFVLHLLATKPRFGNDIMHAIEERTRGRWGPNPGAIYPLLTAMEESGLVEGEWEDPHKRTRKIYHLTETGHQELARIKDIMRPKLDEAISLLQELSEDMGSDF